MSSILKNDWKNYLDEEFDKSYYRHLRDFLKNEYQQTTIFPSMHDIFNAFHLTPYAQVKVVILGQDPYHGPNQAHGLSFSVKPGNAIPPSLLNIYKELKQDLGCSIPNHGYLKKWAEQGVLLLNTVLTVRAHAANSHKNKGWETFTDEVIKHLNNHTSPIVFILWGSHARAKKSMITQPNHYIIESPHPSPLSAHRGFFGSRPFSKTNEFLKSVQRTPIDWQINTL